MEIYFEAVQNVNIHTTSPIDNNDRRFVHPPQIHMSNTEFMDGFRKGLGNSLTDINANVPLTDTEIIDLVRFMFEEGTPTDNDLAYLVGSLIGVLTAKM